MPASTKAKPKAPKVADLPADLSPIVRALEVCYRMIQRKYPDAPNATIVVKRDMKAWGHTTVAKIWAPGTAKETDLADRFEIMISGENITRGAEAVAATLLHEAAHARNLGKGVLDTDVNGRHNKKFADTATEHGLVVASCGWRGYGTDGGFTDEGRKVWARLIASIDAAMKKSAKAATPDASHVGIETPKPGTPAPGGVTVRPTGGLVAPPRRGNRNLTKAVCDCGFSIRASVGVLEKCAPVCSTCGAKFLPV